MVEPNGEWGTQEYASEECNEGKVSWILNKGLELGKKMLITGFVISSAPLVLPPLVVISAIGFAVSVPSGIVLASYACTEKLMNKFLPMPDHLEKGEVVEVEEAWLGGNYYFDMGTEEEEERKDIQRGVEERIELEDEKVRNDGIEEGKAVEEGDYGKEGVKVDVPIEENGYEEDVSEDLDVGKESPEEKPKEKPEQIDESQSKEEEPVKVEGVILNLTEDDEESGDSTVEVTTIVIEGKGGEEGIKEEEIAKETRTLLEEIRDEGKAENQETPQESATSKGDQSGASTAELPTSQGAEEPKDAGSSSEKGVKSTPSNEAKKKKNVKEKPQQQQQEKVSYDEEKIWEEIEAVRNIVGYKATPQKSSLEELKDLYLFTGVEPPASFKEHSDLAEVDSKLQFLKSIIGVK